MFKKYFTLLTILFFGSFPMIAQGDGIPQRPNPPALVNDLTASGFLSSSEKQQLEVGSPGTELEFAL